MQPKWDRSAFHRSERPFKSRPVQLRNIYREEVVLLLSTLWNVSATARIRPSEAFGQCLRLVCLLTSGRQNLYGNEPGTLMTSDNTDVNVLRRRLADYLGLMGSSTPTPFQGLTLPSSMLQRMPGVVSEPLIYLEDQLGTNPPERCQCFRHKDGMRPSNFQNRNLWKGPGTCGY